jgi:hypothetical protein
MDGKLRSLENVGLEVGFGALYDKGHDAYGPTCLEVLGY